MNSLNVSAQTAGMPLQPRKLPRQNRSRFLVSSLLEACLKILVEGGRDALTTTELARVSGIGSGSIYQYFPNMDAIVVATIKNAGQQEVNRLYQKVDHLLHTRGSQSAIKQMLIGIIRINTYQFNLDRKLFSEYALGAELFPWAQNQSIDGQTIPGVEQLFDKVMGLAGSEEDGVMLPALIAGKFRALVEKNLFDEKALFDELSLYRAMLSETNRFVKRSGYSSSERLKQLLQ